jgi:translation initiation factor eIF-2B subunit delta
MTSTTPSTTSGPSTAGASPSIPQTTATSASNNGESSQPKSKPTNPPQSAKPNAKGKEPKEEGGGGAKGKSAKELKKEKRAALVAARGGGEEGDAPGSSTPGPGPTGRPDKVSIDGTPQSQNQPTSSNRPTFPSHDSILSPAPRTEGFYSHVVTHKHPDTREAFNSGRIHPLVVRLGVLMANGELRGANARTMGMMSAFKEVIRDYETPESVVMWKDLMSHLSPMISFLEGCRPKGTGGGNAIR